MSGCLWHPVASCAARCRRIGSPTCQSDRDLEFWKPEAWVLDAGRIGMIGGVWLLDGRRGLEEVPTCSTFQEVGGLCMSVPWGCVGVGASNIMLIVCLGSSSLG